MHTDPSDRPESSDPTEPGSRVREQDGQEIDDADIPILFEAVEPSEDAPTALVETDEGVVTLSLTDALVEDPDEPHQAPLIDPDDEDERLHTHNYADESKELAAMTSILATPPEATSADAAASLSHLSDAQLPGAWPEESPPDMQSGLTGSYNRVGSLAGGPDDRINASARKSENPFLPQHILDRLNQGRRNLVEEIAQSSAALDASTARLRSRTRSERFERINELAESPGAHRGRVGEQRDQLIDDLVEEFLPLIAAELRRRLKRILKD